ncbi:hypothetical protein PRIPAC_76362 [Pristionchus pacificus]|uniref:Uncharacterized protein n=1 Tax=Pristionchus pacificus TaxID=54126 RepID=A0A2A6C612_PRIPA|nr:hypothetical protein PRIPAC_76362 [Pristionchus pacificus]|eukprot:PDM73461.1 hypothetical protein PRIPAC_40817 [Pristionchus pacificus]
MGKDRPIEPNGTDFTVSSQNKYVIEGLLGSGGFGEVYKVCLQRDRKMKYAMKTDRVGIPAMCERLKIECFVFEKFRTTKGNRQHFVHMGSLAADDGASDDETNERIDACHY